MDQNMNQPMTPEVIEAILLNMNSAVQSCEAAIEILKKASEESTETKLKLSYALNHLQNTIVAKRWLMQEGQGLLAKQQSPA